MEKETLIKHILCNSTVGIDIKGKVVLLHRYREKDNTIVTHFLSFEDIMDDNKSEMENLSSRQIDLSRCCDTEKYFIIGNCVLKVSNTNIVKKSYWMSISYDEKTKTESIEMPMKKKRK